MIWTPKNKFKKYDIYKNGTIINTETNKEIKWDITQKGYAQVTLFKKGERFRFKVHRLVAWNYLPLNIFKKEINHKDGNKLNNNISNLEWVTSSENKIHAIKLGLYPKTRKRTKDQTSKNVSLSTVYKIARDLFVYKMNTTFLADKYNISKNIIRHIKNKENYKFTIKKVFDDYKLK